MPAHIKARRGDIAERVVVSGDADRVRQLSRILKNAKLVNDNRGFITYTGEFGGENLTVACHGIGAPSTAIVVEELIMLGARAIVRLGTCGGLLEKMRIGDVVVATGAAYSGGTLQQYLKGDHISPVPDFELTTELISVAKNDGLKYYLGPVFSSDLFYDDEPNFVRKWSGRGYLAVEMESATLFGLGMLKGIKTACALIVSNNISNNQQIVDAETLRGFANNIGLVVFKSLAKFRL
jgi:5'-methylthioadenosine phosphorylase